MSDCGHCDHITTERRDNDIWMTLTCCHCDRVLPMTTGDSGRQIRGLITWKQHRYENCGPHHPYFGSRMWDEVAISQRAKSE